MEKRIYYQNRTFALGTTKRYYYASKQGKMIALHRYKYEQEIGPIPEGFHVHHKDGNHFNNDIDNLEAIDPKKHMELHPPSADTILKWNTAGVAASRVSPWKKSEEGVAFYAKHYENMKHLLHQKFKRNCSNCNKEFESIYKKINCYCSNSCKSAFRRKGGLNRELFNCAGCGKEFNRLKYMNIQYCCVKCEKSNLP